MNLSYQYAQLGRELLWCTIYMLEPNKRQILLL